MATRIPRWARDPAIDADQMGEVYARAISMFAPPGDCAPSSKPGRGYRLFWGRSPDRVAFVDLPVGDRYAILGRHHCCDAVLAEDPEISLRHLLAAAVYLDDGSVALRVLDLRGSMPFFLDDDVPRRSIVASGPVALRLGRYVIGATPLDERAPVELAPPAGSAPPAGASDAPARTAALGTPAHAAAASVEAEGARCWVARKYRTDAAGPPPRSIRPGRATHVTLLPPAAELGDAPSSPESSAAPSSLEAGDDSRDLPRGGGRITVERAGRGASIEVSSADLDVGLIIGRADKCTDRGIRAVLNEWVSRAHLLIMRQSGEIHAYDLASMNGTYRDGRMIRHVVLSERGLVLHLGSGAGVALRWQGASAPVSQGTRPSTNREASPLP